MSRRNSAPLVGLALDPSAAEPLHRQLYDQLRHKVLSGNLAAGSRLPSSRALARELGCARNTVLSAFDQLTAEGYLEACQGSGSFVTSVLPEELLGLSSAPARQGERAQRMPKLSERGRALTAARRDARSPGVAFTVGMPDLEAFPFELWARLLGRAWRVPAAELLRHGDPAGYPPLRQAIADYLNAVRGLGCRAEQILITSGSQQAVDLVARILLDPGEGVWLEDPGYTGLRGPLVAAGLKVCPVPVDDDGFDLAAARAGSDATRLAIVTPSHQYPLGRVLSLQRRLALLDWAYEQDGWILEDDYDSEYRYAGRPLAALTGLDRSRRDGGGRVIYLGSFSKVLFPALRLAYLVIPEPLVEAVISARRALDDHPSMVVQPALARFISEGHFASHVRRMRVLYAARQQALLAAAERHLADLLDLRPDEAGMHLVARPTPLLAARMDDREATARAAATGLTVSPLSSYYLGEAKQQGLLLGYAAVPEAEMERAVARLATALA
ncbi:MAG: PLP-dependent aminotransferase family protein [Pseudomonadota bacterium]